MWHGGTSDHQTFRSNYHVWRKYTQQSFKNTESSAGTILELTSVIKVTQYVLSIVQPVLNHPHTQKSKWRRQLDVMMGVIPAIISILMCLYVLRSAAQPGRTGAIHNWCLTFTASPGVLQEITADPITVYIQHALANLCKSHNCSRFYNSCTGPCGTGSAPASITQPPMSASSHFSTWTDSKHVRLIWTKTNAVNAGVKWLQMFTGGLWTRVNKAEILLVDSDASWLSFTCLFFLFSWTGVAAIRQGWQPLGSRNARWLERSAGRRLSVLPGWHRSNSHGLLQLSHIP